VNASHPTRPSWGKRVRLNGRNTNIVGVMPAGFHYPLGAEIWMPLTFTLVDRADRLSRNLSLLASLKDGVSRKQAEAELQAFSNQFQRQYPTTNIHRTATLLPLREEQYVYTAPMFLMLQAAAGFVLLLACANLLNLLLAQAVGRRREIAVRSALGADRLRLARLFTGETMLLTLLAVSFAVSISFISVTAIRIALGATSDNLFRQVLGEALTLAGIGLALGLPVAYGLNLLAASQLFGLNGLSWPMLATFTAGILLVALVPARRAMRSDPILALRFE